MLGGIELRYCVDFLCCMDFMLMLILKFLDMNFDETEDCFDATVC